jgi:hypothetical protein
MNRHFPTFEQSPAEPTTLNFERMRLLLLSQQPEVSPLHNWAAACHQYRCFLGIKQRYPAQLLVPPSPALQLWQAHILDTRTYRSDCLRLLKRFLDHLPNLGLNGPKDQQQLQEARVKCRELLLLHYGPESLLT